MKKIFLGIIVIVFAVFLSANLNVLHAEGDKTVETISGAAIRTTDPVGLKFAAHVEGEFEEGAKYGFVVAKGTFNDTQMKQKLMNGTAIFTSVDEVDEDGNYYLSIIDIPTTSYLQDITVIAMVNENGTKNYADDVCTKNIYDVACAAKADAGYVENEFIETIIEEGPFDIMLYTGASTSYHADMADEFVADFNAYFDKSFSKVDFFGNTYDKFTVDECRAFFLTSTYSSKWEWMYDYMNAVRVESGKKSLNDASIIAADLRGEIHTFINLCDKVSGYGSIYYDRNDYRYKLTITDIPFELPNLTFKGFKQDGWYNNSSFTGDKLTSIKEAGNYYLNINPITYTIKYYDGEDEILDLEPTTYNVRTSTFSLPDLEIEGTIFGGWYDNDELKGMPITEITKGSVGNKTFYAKLTGSSNATVHVTYDLNGGVWDVLSYPEFETEGEMSLELLNTPRESRFVISNNKNTTFTYWYKLFIKYDSETNLYKVVNEDNDHEVSTFDPSTYDYYLACSSSCENSAAKKFFVTDWNTSTNSRIGMYVYIGGDILSIPKEAEAAPGLYPVKFYPSDSVKKEIEEDLILEKELMIPCKNGYVFAGWKNSIDDSITTSYPGYLLDPGDITYIAQWAEIVSVKLETNGGVPYSSWEDMTADLLLDINTTLGNPSPAITASSFQNAETNGGMRADRFTAFFANENMWNKWQWFIKFIADNDPHSTAKTVVGNVYNSESHKVEAGDAQWFLMREFKGFLNQNKDTFYYTGYPLDFSDETVIETVWNSLLTGQQVEFKFVDGETFNLPLNMYKEGYVFDGWYTMATGGEKVTTVSTGSTVYAHWTLEN